MSVLQGEMIFGEAALLERWRLSDSGIGQRGFLIVSLGFAQRRDGIQGEAETIELYAAAKCERDFILTRRARREVLGSNQRDFVRQPVLGMQDLIDTTGGHNLTDPENGVQQGGLGVTSVFQSLPTFWGAALGSEPVRRAET